MLFRAVIPGSTCERRGHDDSRAALSVINNGQHEAGSGGNGGAVYQDGGNATHVVLCGVDIESNKTGNGAFGGGVFMTSNDFSGTMTVRDSTITGNTGAAERIGTKRK